MAFSQDPEITAGQQRMFGTDPEPAAPIPVGEIEARRQGVGGFLAMVDVAQPIPEDVTVTDHEIAVSDGATIPARWYAKDGAAPGSAALYLHGGAMILGSFTQYHGTLCRYVSATGVPMLAVDYRLAPEFPHPTPVEDAYAALAWLADHADGLGVDPARIAVMGDSGGGGIAAGLAILARDKGGPAIARQILVYPMLDDRTAVPDPYLRHLVTADWDFIITGWQAVLGEAYGTDDVSPYAAPARVADPTGLPPMYLEALELDLFRDENIAYAARALAAGVSTELHVHPGVPHGGETVAPDSAVARRIMADRLRVLRSL